tara:strand:- start:276 stop:572 length:297 start_codon:yes stop_codon:yes gene_type:complete
MTISKKDFEAIAEAIKETRIDSDGLPESREYVTVVKPNIGAAIDRLTLRLAVAFNKINPKFDKERFIKATARYIQTEAERESLTKAVNWVADKVNSQA